MYTKAMRRFHGGKGAVSLVSITAVLCFALLAAFAGGIYFFLRNEAREKAATPSAPSPAQARIGFIEDFVLPDQSGEPVSLKALGGRRPILLYIFSPFCGHCSGRLNEFSKFMREHQYPDFAVVGVLWQGSPERARTTLSQTGLPGPLLSDKDGVLCGRLGVGEFTAFVLDRQLAVRYRGELTGLEAAMAAAR